MHRNIKYDKTNKVLFRENSFKLSNPSFIFVNVFLKSRSLRFDRIARFANCLVPVSAIAGILSDDDKEMNDAKCRTIFISDCVNLWHPWYKTRSNDAKANM